MKHDVIIIGAGIVGLATAHQIQAKNPNLNVLVLEKESGISKHQSGNNSGVIHSGVYYKPGSLRAQNCIRGYNLLLEFCKTHAIEYEITGKVIVATKEVQLGTLQQVYEKGLGNKMEGLKLIGPEEIKEKEPHVEGLKAIWVPQAGIVDYRLVAAKLQGLIEQAGGSFNFDEKVKHVQRSNGTTTVETDKGTYEGKLVINCAGLYSDRIAKFTHENLGIQILPFRGEYYKLKNDKEYLAKNLIYPAPDPAFPWLGVHFTRMARGGVEAGPNAVLAFRREGYKTWDINLSELMETITYSGFRKMARKYWRQGASEYYRSFSKSAFTKALQDLIPEIQEADLVEGGAGVRALACDKTGNLLDDYVFFDDDQVINVCNAPSPAATSSLSIGLTIAEMAIKKLN